MSDITEELIGKVYREKDISLCGIFTQLSPMKRSKRNSCESFFDGRMSNGHKSMRVVCFNSKLHGENEKAKANRESVGFNTCEIKRTSYGDEFELLMTGRPKDCNKARILAMWLMKLTSVGWCFGKNNATVRCSHSTHRHHHIMNK